MKVTIKLGTAAIIGIAIGILIETSKTISGVLKIDTSDPEKDLYRIEIEDLDKIKKKKRIILKVEKDS